LLPAPRRALRIRRKLGATPAFGKAGTAMEFAQKKARARRPGFYSMKREIDQAAGL
jgi:hypothetical protein